MQFLLSYKRLLPMLIFTVVLVIVRIVYSRTFAFCFIPWNLLLALMPLYFSYKIRGAKNPSASWIYMALWLMFFPNSMYIITDLFHLRQRQGMPLWYDLLLLFTAALNGLIAGFLSLKEIEQHLYKSISSRYMPLMRMCLFLLCAYGIYLGRYLRWNSWDIIINPFSLLHDIAQDIFHPFQNRECWLLTILFGTWLSMLYKYFKKVQLN